MDNKTYDAMKWVAQYLLPGLASLYAALSSIWNLPFPEEIVGTIVAIDTFLGLLLGISAALFKAKEAAEGCNQPDNLPTVRVWNSGLSWLKFPVMIQISTKTYDILIIVAQYALPALGTLVFSISGIWDFQYGQQVVGTIAAVDTFLGILLGISTSQYQKKALANTNPVSP